MNMTDQPKSALHQFADDLCAALKSPEFETKTFQETVAECLEPLIKWDESDYIAPMPATRDYPAEGGYFDGFAPVEEWARDALDSLLPTARAEIAERAHERALKHREG